MEGGSFSYLLTWRKTIGGLRFLGLTGVWVLWVGGYSRVSRNKVGDFGSVYLSISLVGREMWWHGAMI